MTVQLLDITADAYHADPCEQPSLNATVATALILETPAHAKQKHPRLADTPWKKESQAMDDGTAVHQMLLGDDRCEIVHYPDFRTNAAKEARDEIRARGKVPVLSARWLDLMDLANSLKQQLAHLEVDPPLFVDGRPEQTIVWEEDGVHFRARLDWIRTDLQTIDDLKKARTAQPRRFHKALYQMGYDIKAAFYVRAAKAAFGVQPVFRWVAIEPDPPYALSVHKLSVEAMHAAQVKVDRAIEIWKECLDTGEWPAYPDDVQTVDLPPWLREEQWDDTALTAVPF